MIDVTLKNTVFLLNDLYREDKYSLVQFKKARKIIAQFLVQKIQGIKIDDDIIYGYFLRNMIVDLVATTNDILKKRKQGNEEVIRALDNLVRDLTRKKNRIMTPYRSTLKEVTSFKENTKDKIKVIFEDENVSIFFDPIQFQDYKDDLEDIFAKSSLVFNEPKKIESIGMFSAKIKNIKQKKDEIIDHIKLIVNSKDFDYTIISEDEILINFSN